MEKIVFATQNPHKVEEISALLSPTVEIIGLSELNFSGEIPETELTLEGNALQKSSFIHEKFGLNCFADDTGLEIEALNGEPGVFSARYAGEGCSFEDNIQKVLKKLQGEKNRKARFRTVISLILNNEKFFFEGEVNGHLLEEKHGEKGFGYDPIFVPNGYEQTFAEMPLSLKNQISHRGKAVQKLIEFLQKRF